MRSRYLLLFAPVLAACGDGPTTIDEPVAFHAQISAPHEREIVGKAEFRTDLPNSGIGNAFRFFVAVEGSSTIRHSFALFRWSNAAFSPGVYQIGYSDAEPEDPNLFVGGFVLEYQQPGSVNCTARLGTLEITSATATRVTGRFNYVASCPSQPGGLEDRTVTVAAEFDAVEGTFSP